MKTFIKNYWKDIIIYTLATIVMLLAIYIVGFILGRIDTHAEVGTVIAIERLDVQKVYIEIGNGHTSIEEFDLDTPIDIGDKCNERVQEFEDANAENDEPVGFISWIEE